MGGLEPARWREWPSPTLGLARQRWSCLVWSCLVRSCCRRREIAELELASGRRAPAGLKNYQGATMALLSQEVSRAALGSMVLPGQLEIGQSESCRA